MKTAIVESGLFISIHDPRAGIDLLGTRHDQATA